MAGVTPLKTLRIKKLIDFKQITPGVITGDLINALKQCGIDFITGCNKNHSEFSIGQMSVLGNTFYGLKVSTAKDTYSDSFYFSVPGTEDLKKHPVQMGFRLTQSAVSKDQTKGNDAIITLFTMNSSIDINPVIKAKSEDSSLYYEMVFRAEKDSNGADFTVVQIYVNKEQVGWGRTYSSEGQRILVDTGGVSTIGTDAGFSYIIGDMYVAELDYNSDSSVTPQLLGNLILKPFSVASYTGDKHTNTKSQDIVTALNTLDPNNDMGALAIKPVEQPASVTFNVPDIAVKSIYGVSLNIVYKDSIAPNNRLSYQITEGTTQLPTETITERHADITGYTTFSRIMTTPEGGGEWNADNLKFKLDIVNNGVE